MRYATSSDDVRPRMHHGSRTLTLARDRHAHEPHGTIMPDLVDGLLFYCVFLFSTTLHEAAHAWAALRGGDRTAYEGGQVTLDPRPHIRREPIGIVVCGRSIVSFTVSD